MNFASVMPQPSSSVGNIVECETLHCSIEKRWNYSVAKRRLWFSTVEPGTPYSIRKKRTITNKPLHTYLHLIVDRTTKPILLGLTSHWTRTLKKRRKQLSRKICVSQTVSKLWKIAAKRSEIIFRSRRRFERVTNQQFVWSEDHCLSWTLIFRLVRLVKLIICEITKLNGIETVKIQIRSTN